MAYRIGAFVQDVTSEGTPFIRRQTVAEAGGASPYGAPPNPYAVSPYTPPQYGSPYGSPPINPYAQYGAPPPNPYQYMPTPYSYTDPYSSAYNASPYGLPYGPSPYGYGY